METVQLETTRTIVRQVEEDGPEETIKTIEKTLNGSLAGYSTIHFEIHLEYADLLKKAIDLIKEGKLDELRKIDERLLYLRLENEWE